MINKPTSYPSRSLPIAQKGIRTTEDFAELMSAMMSDIIEKRITPDIANTAVKAGQQLLKVVEMQIRHGKEQGGKSKVLDLLPPKTAVTPLMDLPEKTETEKSIDARFNKWAKKKGYGKIANDDPRRPDLIDQFYDEEEKNG